MHVRAAFWACLFACGVSGACGGPTARVVQDDLGVGPALPPPGQWALSCARFPRRDGLHPPEAVIALCGATKRQKVRVVRVDGGLRVRLRFEDVPGRVLELYVYRDGSGFERGAQVVTRARGADPVLDTPEAGWLAVQHYDRQTRSIAIQFSLRYPGAVVNGSLREGDVPLPPPPPPAARPDPWRLDDAGPHRD